MLAVEPEAQCEHALHARVEPEECLRELLAPQLDRRRVVGTVRVHVLDQVGVHALAVPDRRLERHGVLDEIEQLLDPLRGEAALLCELLLRRLAIQLLRELSTGPHQPPHLIGDVDGQTNRPPLVCERARDRLSDPPGRVRRELVAHLVVELLDRANKAEVPLLDQIQERDTGFRVVPRDRHHEPEVGLDELLLGLLVALVLAARELALLDGRQEWAVADRADVELQRVLGRGGRRRLGGLAPVVLVGFLHGLGQQLEPRLCCRVVVGEVWERPLLHRRETYRPLRNAAWRFRPASDEGSSRESPLQNLDLTPSPADASTKMSGRKVALAVMCGIAGYSLSLDACVDRTLAARALLAGIAERGADAAGFAYRGDSGSVSVHK